MKKRTALIVGLAAGVIAAAAGVLAALGFLPAIAAELVAVVAFSWFFKVAVEVVMTPVTYLVVGALKRIEAADHFDIDTRFTPFTLRD